MTTMDHPKDYLHNNNDCVNLKDESTYLYGKEVLMIFVCWENGINNDHHRYFRRFSSQ